jgi:putative endonuclease
MDTRYRKDAGDRGEAQALEHLTKAGLTLVQRNYRCTGGEIDLIMLDQQTLVFIEVRFRQNQLFGGALASITSTKQQRIHLAAQRFLQTHREYRCLKARFDAVSLEGDAQVPKLSWIKNAFGY